MSRSLLLLLAGIFFIKGLCFSSPLLEKENFVLSLDGYLRTDGVTFKNVVDLDNKNSDDTTTYLGIDYSLGYHLEFKNSGPKIYLKLERNGPSDYSAPLFVHNTLMNTGGVIEEYRNDELLPQIEEFWYDTAFLSSPFRFKVGLYTYEVGNGFSLNGAYENFGGMLYNELKGCIWRLYYCRPDSAYKNHLGPRIRQDEEQGYYYNSNAANFFAADAKFDIGKNSFQPYIGVLTDYTAAEKRKNSFTAPIKRDILGTVGIAYHLKHNRLSLDLETARNFGEAKSDSPDYKDISHMGYMAYMNIGYGLGKLTPTLQFFLGSGNKVSLEDATTATTTLSSGRNRAFSYTSPSNDNLTDSISGSHVDIRPIVAMGSGYGLNYGVPRPGTFYVSDFDNIIIASSGFDFEPTEKLWIGLYGYYLRSFTRAVGMLNSEPKRLSCELGYEADFFIDYRLNKNILISFLGGYFIPGRYHKELRDDMDGRLFSPYVRGDGKPDPAYQVELAMEFTF